MKRDDLQISPNLFKNKAIHDASIIHNEDNYDV